MLEADYLRIQAVDTAAHGNEHQSSLDTQIDLIGAILRQTCDKPPLQEYE
jgi:hypothetical protein